MGVKEREGERDEKGRDESRKGWKKNAGTVVGYLVSL